MGVLGFYRWYADAIAIRETLLRHRYNPVATSPRPVGQEGVPAFQLPSLKVIPTCSCGWTGDEDVDAKAYDQWIGHALKEIRGGS